MPETSDKAPLDPAYQAILAPLTGAVLKQIAAFKDAGIPVTFNFRVEVTGALRFQAGADGKPTVLFDTDEGKETRPCRTVLEINGLPPAPTLEAK